VYSTVADRLGITLEECYQGMYADLDENKQLVRFGNRVSDECDGTDDSTTTTRLTGDSKESYAEDTITVEWLLTRYNLALAQAVLYDATEMRVQVWDSFATLFSYVKLFGHAPYLSNRQQLESCREYGCRRWVRSNLGWGDISVLEITEVRNTDVELPTCSPAM